MSRFLVRLVAAGDFLFIVANPSTPRLLEHSAGLDTASTKLHNFLRPPVDGLMVSFTGYRARHRGITRRAHVLKEGLHLLVDASLRRTRVSIPGSLDDCRLEQLAVPLLDTPPWRWARILSSSSGTAGLRGGCISCYYRRQCHEDV